MVLRVVGFVGVLTAFMVGIGSNLASMIDPPSLILVLGSVLAMLLIGRHNIGTMISTVFSSDADEGQLREAIEGYRMARYYSMAAAALSLGVGATVVLKNWNGSSAIGPGIAIILLGTLYAVLIGFVLFLALQAGLQKRLGESVDDNIVPAGLLMVVYCTVMTALVFAILTASFHTPVS